MNLKATELANLINENLEQVKADLAELKEVVKRTDALISFAEEISKDLIARDKKLKEQAK